MVDIVFSRGFRRFRRGHLLREIRGICVSPPKNTRRYTRYAGDIYPRITGISGTFYKQQMALI